MRALVKLLSVTMPTCPPVRLIDSTPWPWTAIAIKATDSCSPVASSMSISRGGRAVIDLGGEGDQLVRLVAAGADDDDDPVPRPVRRDRAGGGGLDAGRVGDARAAELLHDQGHGRGGFHGDAREAHGPRPVGLECVTNYQTAARAKRKPRRACLAKPVR